MKRIPADKAVMAEKRYGKTTKSTAAQGKSADLGRFFNTYGAA